MFIYLCDYFSDSDYIASDEGTINERWSGKDLKGSGGGLS
jgi:hypothetical protein